MLTRDSIDAEIRRWAQKHSLSLSIDWAGQPSWSTYVSSVDGECFQIWIHPSSDGKIGVHAGYVEGPRDPEPQRDWLVDSDDVRKTLEDAFRTVLDWMAPSARYYPKRGDGTTVH